jgi:phosphatidylglycerophosphate synthase
MVMNLHRTDDSPQWERTPESMQNIWQRMAKKTHGIITPANAISLAGLYLTISGLQDFKRGDKKKAITKVISGRLCDIADGYVAERTKTKSPIGEAVDATVDKISMAHGLYVMSKTNTLPSLASASFLSQNVINTAATALSKKRGVELHPSAEGKITTLLQWAAIGGYAIASTEKSRDDQSMVKIGSDVLASTAAAIGAVVNIQYVTQAVYNP